MGVDCSKNEVIKCVGLSHNTERGGESVLSIFTLKIHEIKIQDTDFIVETSKEKTTNTNSLIR